MIKVKDLSCYCISRLEEELTLLSMDHPRALNTSTVEKIHEYSKQYHNKYKAISRLPDESLRAIEDLYHSNSGKLKKLYFSGMTTLGDFCVYCGKYQPGELDHFFSLSKSPQYGIVKLNLVWACPTCNSSKGNECPVDQLKLFHPVLDKIYINNFFLFELKCKNLFKDDQGVIFSQLKFLPCQKVSKMIQSQISKSVLRLGIKERLIERVLEEQKWVIADEVLSRLSELKDSEIADLLKKDAHKKFNQKKYDEYFARITLANVRSIKRIRSLHARDD